MKAVLKKWSCVSGLRESLCLLVETVQNLLGELGNTCNSIVLPLDLEPDLLLERTRDLCDLVRTSLRYYHNVFPIFIFLNLFSIVLLPCRPLECLVKNVWFGLHPDEIKLRTFLWPYLSKAGMQEENFFFGMHLIPVLIWPYIRLIWKPDNEYAV